MRRTADHVCHRTPSFIHGLVLGQLSVVLLIGAFIKFFIFGDPPSPDAIASARATERRSHTLAHKRSLLSIRSSHGRPTSSSSALGTGGQTRPRSSVLRNFAPLTTASILSKTYYNVDAHQPESLDWFNVLLAQTIAQLRDDATRDDAILASLTQALNGSSRPDFLDEIRVTELSLGEEFPIFSNCRIIPLDEDGIALERGTSRVREQSRVQARMDVDLSDFITLALETKLLLNYPKPLVAALPVALSVTVVRFSGTLSISFIPGTAAGGASTGEGDDHQAHGSGRKPINVSPTTLAFSFLDDYRLDLSIKSLVGSRSRLQDVPKVAQLVETRLHAWFDERCVEPRFQQIELPSLWPRKKNTRGGEDMAGDDGVGMAGARGGSIGRAMSKEVQRDLREEARREIEEEECRRRADAQRRDEEGLRWRGLGLGMHEHVMPGSMPL